MLESEGSHFSSKVGAIFITLALSVLLGSCGDEPAPGSVSDAGLDASDAADVGSCIDEDGDGYFAGDGCVGEAGAQVDCDDTDGDIHPGAEEVCDEVDNDCDGIIDNLVGDDPVDLDSNIEHCGQCGLNCVGRFSNAQAVCVEGGCALDGCDEHFFDVDQDDSNGCEYECQASIDGQILDSDALCDGVDNDCDGEVDEDFADLAQPCTDGVGQCEESGVFECSDDATGVTCSAEAGSIPGVCEGNNRNPQAEAGDDTTVALGASFSLDGSASSDPDGDTLTFQWSLVSAPTGSQATLGDADAEVATLVADVRGVYEIELEVSDAGGLSGTDTVVLTTNVVPVADAGTSVEVNVGDTVHLNGLLSHDPDGGTLSYQWSLVSSPSGSSAQPSDPSVATPHFTADVVGSFVAELTVDDGDASDTDQVTIVAREAGTPVADAGQDQRVRQSETVQLDATNSVDPDGDALTYSWSIVAQPAGSTAALDDPSAATPTMVVDVVGDYELELVASDGTLTDSDQVTITARDSGAPSADAGDDQSITTGNTVSLDGSASTDPDGDTLSFQWTLQEVPAGSRAQLSRASMATPALTTDLNGAYVVELEVSDGTWSDTDQVVVNARALSAPSADAGADQTVAMGDSVQLDASASSDPDGDALTYQWGFSTQPPGATSTLDDTSSPTPTFVADAAGVYELVVWVSDGSHSSTDSVEIFADGTPPVVQITSPSSGERVGGQISVEADAFDRDSPVASVKFWRDQVGGRLIGEDANASDGWSVSWDTTGLADGTYTLVAEALDQPGNSATDQVSITVDNSAPNVTVTSPNGGEFLAAGDAFTIRWTATSTNSPIAQTSVDIEYSADGGTTWQTTVSGTQDDGAYSWVVPSINSTDVLVRVSAANANAVRGSDESNQTFVIDMDGPTVQITAPADGDVIRGTRDLTADAQDNGPAGMDKVQFRLNSEQGALLGEDRDGSDGWTFSWNTTLIGDGVHTVVGVGSDAAGNSASHSIDVTVDNTSPSNVFVVSPGSGEFVRGSVELEANATDAQGLDRVEFIIDGANVGSVQNSPLTLTWDSTSVSDGSHGLLVRAYDEAGNVTESGVVNFMVDNTAPTPVTLDAPLSGDVVSGTVTVEGGATDNYTIASLEFLYGGVLIAVDNSLSAGQGEAAWDTTGVSNGSHVLTVVAYDEAGNQASSSGVTVNVDNAAPSVAVTSPGDGDVVTGVVTVSAQASDTETSVTRVRFWEGTVGGTLIGEDVDGTNGWTTDWDASVVSQGEHVLIAEAVDEGENAAVDQVTVTVNNSNPLVTLTNPVDGEHLRGVVSLTADASDPGGAMDRVKFWQGQVGGTLIGEDTNGADGWSVNWNSDNFAQTSHTLIAEGIDTANNTSTDSVTVTVDRTDPTNVTVDAPVGGDSVSGIVRLEGSATDNAAIDRFEFKVGASVVGTDDSPTAGAGSADWDSNAVSDGTHDITVVAYDKAGNVTSSTLITVTVDNTAPGLAVTQPNGGEALQGGDTYTITWTASDALSGVATNSVVIEYSDDTGNSWTEIASGEANDGSYDWLVPADDTLDALIRVSADDVAGNTGDDSSDAAFTIDSTAPTVSVTSPNGGENLAGGSTYTIQWSASDAGSGVASNAVTIEYSTDGGTSWAQIATGEANDGAYEWAVPMDDTSQAMVRVSVDDNSGNSANDTSDTTFVVDSTAPSVDVVQPNGGETLFGGSTYTIQWTASDAGSGVASNAVTIEYSSNGGTSWTQIATGEANDGAYDWAVPSDETSQALVRVSIDDASGNSASDQSDATFIVDSTAPSVTVDQPNGAEQMQGGSVYTIGWTAADSATGIAANSVTLEYSTDAGTSWTQIAASEANDGSFAWTVPTVDSADALVRVSADDNAGNTGSDRSDATFTIDSTAPSVAVTQPNGGEELQGGSSYTIEWTASDGGTGIAANSVAIEYSSDGGSTWTQIVSGEANDGAYAWSVPMNDTSSASIRVSVDDAVGNSASDGSDAVFTVDSTPPTVSVTQPNGAEMLAGASTYSIEWTTGDAGSGIAADSVTIDYSSDGGSTWTQIATGESDDGSYLWTVPSDETTTALIRVSALDETGNSASDASDATFTIDSTAPSVAVSQPNGAEELQGGSTYSIEWTATDASTGVATNSVTLEYSIDGGTSWTQIAAGEANDGSFAWSVPSVDSANALVRVFADDNAGNTGSDGSDATFAIDSTAPSVSVSQPNGSEVIAGGSTYSIQWTASDGGAGIAANSVVIEYSSDGGTSWTQIATGEPNDGAYAWAVPSDDTANALVRVFVDDQSGNTGSDVSDGSFTIDSTAPSVSVSQPNGAEELQGGSTYTIGWSTSDGGSGIAANSVTLEYSSDGGTNWIQIAAGEADDGAYDWTVPSDDTSTALVRVSVEDVVGNTGVDASDAAFLIDSTAPSVSVTQPNGGEEIRGGSTYTIQWTASDSGSGIAANSVTIQYSSDNGVNWTQVATGEANDGSYAWTVPSDDTSAALVRVLVDDNVGHTGTDPSDATFLVDNTAPSVTVTSPNGGEQIGGATTYTIEWTATDAGSGIATNSVSIFYRNNSAASWTTVATGEANDGTYTWTTPSDDTRDAEVRVSVADNTGNVGEDVSDASFVVDTSSPTVSVDQPNGGEILASGSTFTILWTADDTASGVSSIKLEYSEDNGVSWDPIASGETNDGSYDWTVPATNSDQVLVQITATDGLGNDTADQSDAVATIDKDAPTVTLTAPADSEAWEGGVQQTITWSATDNLSGVATNSILIEYSVDGGTTWTEIAAGEANDGSFAWTPPSIDNNSVLMRVSAQDNSGLSGSATHTFTIDSTDPTVVLDAPNGGELLKGGDTYTITWTATDNLTPVTIDLWYRDGLTDANGDLNPWIEIDRDIGNSGSHTWTVPGNDNTSAADIRVRATDAASQSAEDFNDADFTVDSTAPVVTVTSPHSSTIISSSQYTIEWSVDDASPGAGIKQPSAVVEYSTDDGSTWTTITGCTDAEDPDGSGSGSCVWSVPNQNTIQGRIRVTIEDLADDSSSLQGNVGSDISEQFVIQ